MKKITKSCVVLRGKHIQNWRRETVFTKQDVYYIETVVLHFSLHFHGENARSEAFFFAISLQVRRLLWQLKRKVGHPTKKQQPRFGILVQSRPKTGQREPSDPSQHWHRRIQGILFVSKTKPFHENNIAVKTTHRPQRSLTSASDASNLCRNFGFDFSPLFFSLPFWKTRVNRTHVMTDADGESVSSLVLHRLRAVICYNFSHGRLLPPCSVGI